MSPAAPAPRPERAAHSVSCNECGAAVPIPRDSEVTFCSYCGKRVFIEPNLRKHHDPLVRGRPRSRSPVEDRGR